MATSTFSPLIFFNVFGEIVNISATVMENHVNFVKKTVFPLELLPLTQCVCSSVTGAICFVLVFLGNIAICGRSAFAWSQLLFPAVFLAFVLFAAGFGMIVASLGVYFKDTRFICAMVLQVLFFVTPIFYPASAIPESFRWVLGINPLSWFVDAGREVLLYGAIPDIRKLLGLIGLGVAVGQVGWGFFSATGKGFADVL